MENPVTVFAMRTTIDEIESNFFIFSIIVDSARKVVAVTVILDVISLFQLNEDFETKKTDIRL